MKQSSGKLCYHRLQRLQQHAAESGGTDHELTCLTLVVVLPGRSGGGRWRGGRKMGGKRRGGRGGRRRGGKRKCVMIGRGGKCKVVVI